MYDKSLDLAIKNFNNCFEKSDGCWEWTGSTIPTGYGRLWYKANIYAHRFSAFLFWEFDLNSKIHVLHHCDNPPCVNPNHFFFGTHKLNILDSIEKKRHGYGKPISLEERNKILNLIKTHTVPEIARLANRRTTTIYRFLKKMREEF